jgi:hypothetical protein
MPDQVEAAVQSLPKPVIHVPGAVVVTLATYGAVRATKDATSFVKKIRANRKAKKAAQNVDTDASQQ